MLVLLAVLWRVNQPPPPDSRMVALAARATMYALPTPTPQQVVVTQVVVVTQIVVVTATPTPLEAATHLPTATSTSTVAPTATPSNVALPTIAPEPEARANELAAKSPDAVEPAAAAVAEPVQPSGVCPSSSTNQYTTVPVAGGRVEHPPEAHADLRLSLRGYQGVDAARSLVDKDGPVDGDPPQLAGLFRDNRAPHFGQTYQVYDWDWGCAEHGCRGALLQQPQVTLVALHMQAGEDVRIPRRNQQIYGGGYKALVLYAEPTRITLGYTREDSVANGYVVHIESFCVDPNLLAFYAGSEAAGRAFLPALREDEPIGVAALDDPLVAVRDRGAFLDPRSRLDWWQGK
ncbi:MAG: hypothetical protein R6W76_09415 [Caldilinea sp.]